MAKNLIFKLGPKHTYELDFREKLSTPWKIFLALSNKFSYIALYIFILFLFVPTLFISTSEADAAYVVYFYRFIIFLLGMLVIKKILSKNLKTHGVPYDLLLLVFTTVVAISLFISTLKADLRFNIWGGGELRMLSGVTVIALWFLYYVLVINVHQKQTLQRFVGLLVGAPLFTTFINILLAKDYFAGLEVIMPLLLPVWFILAFSQKFVKWPALLNIVLTLFIINSTRLSNVEFAEIVISFVVGILVLLAILSLRNYKNWAQLFIDFDKSVDELIAHKLSLKNLLANNQELLILIFGLLITIVGIIWLGVNNAFTLPAGFEAGIDNLKAFNLTGLFLGEGLVNYSGSYFFKMLHVFGLPVFVVFCAFIVMVIKDMVSAIWRAQNKNTLNHLIWIFVSFVSLIVFLLIARGVNDLLVILVWVFAALWAISKNLLAEKNIVDAYEINELENIKDLKWRNLARYTQLLSVIVIIGLTIYLMVIIAEIAKFLIAN